MIRVDNEVQPHQINKIFVSAETELVRQVETVVLVLLNWSDLSILEDIAVDLSGNGGKLSDEIHRVLKCIAPVFLFADALGVGLRKLRLVFKSSDSD